MAKIKINNYIIQYLRTFSATILLVCMTVSMFMNCTVFADNTLVETIAEILGVNSKSDQVKFSEMEYIRPDIEQFRNDVDALAEALDAGAKYSAVEKRLDTIYSDWYNYTTMNTLADIHNCIDLTDTYWQTELDWCNEYYYEARKLIDDMYYICASSDMGKTLERKYFWPGFVSEYSASEESYYSEEIISLKQQESLLLSEYRTMTVSPTIDIGNGEEDYYNLLANAVSDEEYNTIMYSYYDKYNPLAADIYIKLMDIRKRLAAESGYDSYEQMQYYYFFERDYSPEEAGRYLENIAQYMVPLYQQLVDEGIYDNVRYDYLDEKALYNVLDKFTAQMGGKIREAFEFMTNGELYDISFSNAKANMSFQEYIDGYESPFLFMDPEESTYDIINLAHEFGHYTEAYVNENAYATTDLSETYSQSMEYLLLSHLNDIMSGRKSRNLTRMKLIDTVETYVQQASFAEFEKRVYELEPENLSIEAINAISLDVAQKYGYCEPGYEKYYSENWIEIAHFFEYPFYVISYPVSNDIALQIYEMELEKTGRGEKKYLELIDRNSSAMLETVEQAGLQSPFREHGIYDTVRFLSEQFGLKEKIS